MFLRYVILHLKCQDLKKGKIRYLSNLCADFSCYTCVCNEACKTPLVRFMIFSAHIIIKTKRKEEADTEKEKREKERLKRGGIKSDLNYHTCI